MTATSGPGMSLKTEMLGLATKPEQSDPFQAAFSAHGDVLRPILAPTCVADTFKVTVDAFNIAELYQTPVIILSDQEIAQRKETVDPIDTTKFKVESRQLPGPDELNPYRRLRLTESGVSPISHPGMPGGNYLGAGIEHNELGEPTASGSIHATMNEKRFKKLDPLKKRAEIERLRALNPRANLEGYAREIRTFIEALYKDMAHEEATCLDERVLRDDVIVIDGISG